MPRARRVANEDQRVIGQMAVALRSFLSMTGRNVGKACDVCRGDVPIQSCARCYRIQTALDALKAAGE